MQLGARYNRHINKPFRNLQSSQDCHQARKFPALHPYLTLLRFECAISAENFSADTRLLWCGTSVSNVTKCIVRSWKNSLGTTLEVASA